MAMNGHKRILVKAEDTIQRTLEVLDTGSVQIALVVDEAGILLGTVTDGDIRRGVLRGLGLEERVTGVMNTHPVTAQMGVSREDLLSMMTARSIKQVPLVDEKRRVVGLERLDNLLRSPALKVNPAIILAGGQGTRLRPLTEDTPKPLLKVGGRPVLELILQQLRSCGFHQLYISVNYLGHQIEQYFGDGHDHGVSIEYLRESDPLGTAGPLSLMPQHLESPCIVINGDLVTRVNFEHLLEFHSEGGFQITLGVKEYRLQIPYGVVMTENDRVVGFQEKPDETRLVNAGVYVISPSVLDLVPRNEYYDMNLLIEKVMSQPNAEVGAFLIREYWMDVGTAADYQQAQWDHDARFGLQS
jgi:dTDP-glucose pyrophosphorylase